MKSSLPFRGLSAPQLRAVLRPILADPAYRITDRRDWEATVRGLWDGATHREERYAAIALAGHRAYGGWQDPGALPLYAHLVTTGAWWDLVDQVAADRVGAILLHHRDEVGPSCASGPGPTTCGCGARPSSASDLQGADRHPAARRLHRAESRGHVVLDPQGHRVGAAQHARTDPGWVRQAVAGYGEGLSGLSRREALKHL